MKLQTQNQNMPNCLVYAAAMVLEVKAEDILKYIGHHGQETWWPDAHGNAKYRGVHIQEIIDFALEESKCFCPIELYPRSAPIGFEKSARVIWSEDECRTRFITWMQFYSAILILPAHAVAWDVDSHKVFDPNGLIREIEGLQIIEAWALMKSNRSREKSLTF